MSKDFLSKTSISIRELVSGVNMPTSTRFYLSPFLSSSKLKYLRIKVQKYVHRILKSLSTVFQNLLAYCPVLLPPLQETSGEGVRPAPQALPRDL